MFYDMFVSFHNLWYVVSSRFYGEEMIGVKSLTVFVASTGIARIATMVHSVRAPTWIFHVAHDTFPDISRPCWLSFPRSQVVVLYKLNLFRIFFWGY